MDRQAKDLAIKSEWVDLAKQQNILASEEAPRVQLAGEVKAYAGSSGAVKNYVEDIEHSKIEQEKRNRDHTIKVLQEQEQVE